VYLFYALKMMMMMRSKTRSQVTKSGFDLTSPFIFMFIFSFGFHIVRQALVLSVRYYDLSYISGVLTLLFVPLCCNAML